VKKNGVDGWSVLSSQGQVLFYVAMHPNCTVDEIADGLQLTPRSVWTAVGVLRKAGMLESIKEGRRNRYRVILEGPFRHPTIQGVSLRTVLAGLTSERTSGNGSNGAHRSRN
jgi:hypothetical protein